MGFKPPSEAEIQKTILQWLAMRRALAIRVNSGAMFVGNRFVRFNSASGCSDILVGYRGKFAAVEVKRPGNEPTEKQAAFLEQVRSAGCSAIVAYGVDDLQLLLEQLED
jgi:hypothetical protein